MSLLGRLKNPCWGLRKCAALSLFAFGFIYINHFANVYYPNDKLVQVQLSNSDKQLDQSSASHQMRNALIMDAVDQRLFVPSVQTPLSHPLENSCKYPVLQTEDANIDDYISHTRKMYCKTVLPDVVSFVDRTLYINQGMAHKLFAAPLICYHRPFEGTLRPNITVIRHYGLWHHFYERSEKINDDQFEVICYLKNDTSLLKALYKNAFAQVVEKKHLDNSTVKLLESDENNLSVDIIGLDSTSLNMFRRHMPRTFRYFVQEMGGYHLEGYNKVADNSMVNWIPVFTGMRYGNQSVDMPSDLMTNGEPLELELIPWIWKKFEEKGCATMLNDDPMHYTRGLFHYPWNEAVGFRRKPTTHYFRPWHVYHRQFPTENATNFCFNNQPYFKLQLNLVESMLRVYKRKCHFSFSFFTDITHDDQNNLELMDDTMLEFLKKHYKNGRLNNTVLIIMGDHGHRISQIQFTYVGRVEERATFFGVHFPKWFRDKHPSLMKMLQLNKHRLTSNYDVYQMLNDIVKGNFEQESYLSEFESDSTRGISLLREIPANRSCAMANVPEHHCLCMETDDVVPTNLNSLMEWSKAVIQNYTNEKLHLFSKCQSLVKVELIDFDILTTNQMIQHGVRHQIPEFMQRLQTHLVGVIQYYEIEYKLAPSNLTAVIRLQHDKHRGLLFVNVNPLPLNGYQGCSEWSTLEEFCSCTAFSS